MYGSNLAGFTLTLLPCVVAVFPALRGGCCTVLIARFDVNPNKRRLLLLLLLLLSSAENQLDPFRCVALRVRDEKTTRHRRRNI